MTRGTAHYHRAYNKSQILIRKYLTLCPTLGGIGGIPSEFITITGSR